MKYIFLGLLLAFSVVSSAQSLDTLRGQVIDETGEPMIGAVVKVYQDSNLIAGKFNDYDGNFQFILPAGQYRLECSSTGYATSTITGILVGKLAPNPISIRMSLGIMFPETIYRCCFLLPWPDAVENDGVIWRADQIRNRY